MAQPMLALTGVDGEGDDDVALQILDEAEASEGDTEASGVGTESESLSMLRAAVRLAFTKANDASEWYLPRWYSRCSMAVETLPPASMPPAIIEDK